MARGVRVHERSCSVWGGIFDGLALRCATGCDRTTNVFESVVVIFDGLALRCATGCDRTTNAFESGFVVASHALRDAGQDAVCQPDVAGVCKSVRAPGGPRSSRPPASGGPTRSAVHDKAARSSRTRCGSRRSSRRRRTTAHVCDNYAEAQNKRVIGCRLSVIGGGRRAIVTRLDCGRRTACLPIVRPLEEAGCPVVFVGRRVSAWSWRRAC
jgi:hypothetical protein